MKNIGVIGSRARNEDFDFLMCEIEFLKVFCRGDKIISGGCKLGGDRFAEILAKKHNAKIEIYYADWDRHGKSAGFKRNSDIAKNSDLIIAVVKDEKNKYDGGTGDTILKAEKMGKKIVIVPRFINKVEENKNNKYFEPLELKI